MRKPREPKQYMHVKGERVHAPTCKLPVLLPPDPKSSGPDIIVRYRNVNHDTFNPALPAT